MAIILCCIIISMPFIIYNACFQKEFTITTEQIDIDQNKLAPGVRGAIERARVFRDLQKTGINHKFTYKNIISELKALGYTKEQAIKAVRKIKKEEKEKNERSK